jgi:hypothetical protein
MSRAREDEANKAVMSEERINLLHEVIEILPHERRWLQEMRKCCRAALPDATDSEIRCAIGRSLMMPCVAGDPLLGRPSRLITFNPARDLQPARRVFCGKRRGSRKQPP